MRANFDHSFALYLYLSLFFSLYISENSLLYIFKPLFYSISLDSSGKPLGCLELQKPNHKISAIQRTRAQIFPIYLPSLSRKDLFQLLFFLWMKMGTGFKAVHRHSNAVRNKSQQLTVMKTDNDDRSDNVYDVDDDVVRVVKDNSCCWHTSRINWKDKRRKKAGKRGASVSQSNCLIK